MTETKPVRTPAERAHTDALGPTTRIDSTLPGIIGTEEIHSNTRGATFRAGARPPEYLKWYVGQGGVTGTQSGTPFATEQPGEHRAPGNPPPVDWDPEVTDDVEMDLLRNTADASQAGGTHKPTG